MSTLVLILIVILLFAVLGGPYTGWHNYGWGPSGLLYVLVVVLLIWLLVGGRI